MKQVWLIFLFVAARLHAQWVPADSLSLTVRVPAGEHVSFAVDGANGALSASLSHSASELTTTAKAAISRAPEWLSTALEECFAGLDPALQDTYGRIILDARDPLVDEVSFTVAHLSPEVLGHRKFDPAIVTENALGVYRADSLLQYVEIVDSGNAEQGGYYYSTTVYRVVENGGEFGYTLPRDIYYWFVVHPKLQGELPAYIGTGSPEPAAPPEGKFWRTYLWSHREPGYGALCDTLQEMNFLWANKVNSVTENGAIGRLSQWCNLVLPWGGHPEYRWPQPVYLYNQHCGTCSEHGWFASAAARTALIPATLTKASRFDHKWNEFFCGRWIDWEPINGWIDRRSEPGHADDYWSDPSKGKLSGCFNWRGDGHISTTTERYSEVCTLAVKVTDSRGRPLDGARVTIDADGVPGNFLTAAWTGSDGFCVFLLGDGISRFTGAVTHPSGTVPAAVVITDSRPQNRYDWSPKVSVSREEPQLTAVPQPQTATGETVRIGFTIWSRTELVRGRHEYSLYGHSFPCTFSDERQTGTVDLFICDSAGLDAFRRGDKAEVAVVKNESVNADSFFTVPKGTGPWHLVLSGGRKTVVTSVVDVTLRSFRNDGSGREASPAPFRHTAPAVLVHPVRGYPMLTCTLPENTRCTLTLYTVSGKPVAGPCEIKAGMQGRPESFRTGHLTAGTYILRLAAENMSFSEKIAIIR